MNLKLVGRLSVVSVLSTFCPVLGGFTALFFGYSIPFYILGIPLLAVGVVSLFIRTFMLIRYGRQFAGIVKAIADAAIMTALIVLSLVFTTAEMVDTETGFTLRQSGTVWGTVGFIALYIGALIIISLTNQKIGRAYLKGRAEEKKRRGDC